MGPNDEKKLGERNEPSADCGRELGQSALHGLLRSHFHLLLCLNCSNINVVYILSPYKTSFYRCTYHVASRSDSLVSLEFNRNWWFDSGLFPTFRETESSLSYFMASYIENAFWITLEVVSRYSRILFFTNPLRPEFLFSLEPVFFWPIYLKFFYPLCCHFETKLKKYAYAWSLKQLTHFWFSQIRGKFRQIGGKLYRHLFVLRF